MRYSGPGPAAPWYPAPRRAAVYWTCSPGPGTTPPSSVVVRDERRAGAGAACRLRRRGRRRVVAGADPPAPDTGRHWRASAGVRGGGPGPGVAGRVTPPPAG